MAKRIVLAGILGGLVAFLWGFLAHDVLPLGEVGVKPLPNEESVQAALKERIKEDGFYYFPAPKNTPGMSSQQQQDAMMKAMRAGPVAVLVIHPNGVDMSIAQALAVQYGTEMAAMLLAALLLSWSALQGFAARVLFVTLMGLFPTFGVEIPIWNWYGFPTAYMLSQATVHLVGFFLGGLVVARIVRPRG